MNILHLGDTFVQLQLFTILNNWQLCSGAQRTLVPNVVVIWLEPVTFCLVTQYFIHEVITALWKHGWSSGFVFNQNIICSFGCWLPLPVLYVYKFYHCLGGSVGTVHGWNCIWSSSKLLKLKLVYKSSLWYKSCFGLYTHAIPKIQKIKSTLV